MADTIAIDTVALRLEIAKLQELVQSPALAKALEAVRAARPTVSRGESASATRDYREKLAELSGVLLEMFSKTVELLNNAEAYFTISDAKVAEYFYKHDGIKREAE